VHWINILKNAGNLYAMGEQIMIKTRNINDGKRQLCLTGSILTTLRPGEPATYIHNGKVARTSRVMVILEVAPAYVTFETVGSIYTVQFAKEPAGSFIAV